MWGVWRLLVLLHLTTSKVEVGVREEVEELRVEAGSVVEAGVRHEGVFTLRRRSQFGEVPARADSQESLHYTCHPAIQPSLPHFWSSAALRLDMEGHDYQVYIGSNLTTVARLAQESDTAWLYTQLPWRSKDFKLSPFEDTCIGVKTSQRYRMTLQWKTVNYLFLLATLAGLLVFFMAPSLCRNTFFHYTTGIGVGLLLSVLLLTFLVQRRLKQSFFSWVGGRLPPHLHPLISPPSPPVTSLAQPPLDRSGLQPVGVPAHQRLVQPEGLPDCRVLPLGPRLHPRRRHRQLRRHLQAGRHLHHHQHRHLHHPRLGPPENPRTLNLIQWAMQGLALAAVVLSSHHQAASLLLALLLLAWAAVPTSAKAAARTALIKAFFRPEHKLLTEEEFITQGAVETRRALQELTAYCRSPESRPWRTVSRLQSPVRFAEFIEGSSHLTEAEVMEYSHFDYNTTDDEEDDDEVLTDDEDAEDGGRD